MLYIDKVKIQNFKTNKSFINEYSSSINNNPTVYIERNSNDVLFLLENGTLFCIFYLKDFI